MAFIPPREDETPTEVMLTWHEFKDNDTYRKYYHRFKHMPSVREMLAQGDVWSSKRVKQNIYDMYRACGHTQPYYCKSTYERYKNDLDVRDAVHQARGDLYAYGVKTALRNAMLTEEAMNDEAWKMGIDPITGHKVNSHGKEILLKDSEECILGQKPEKKEKEKMSSKVDKATEVVKDEVSNSVKNTVKGVKLAAASQAGDTVLELFEETFSDNPFTHMILQTEDGKEAAKWFMGGIMHSVASQGVLPHSDIVMSACDDVQTMASAKLAEPRMKAMRKAAMKLAGLSE